MSVEAWMDEPDVPTALRGLAGTFAHQESAAVNLIHTAAKQIETGSRTRSGEPATPAFVLGYGIGYHYGREHGDDERGREELNDRFGPSDASNTHQYEGFRMGYSDGVNDYMTVDEGEDG